MAFQFYIADTFRDSLMRLPAEEQALVKQTKYDIEDDWTAPGLSLERVTKNRHDGGFWACRVSRGTRIILHRDGQEVIFCYVAHHDDAWRWAESRRLVPHADTGALQIVQVVERIEEKIIVKDGPPRPWASRSDAELARCAVPEGCYLDVRAATEESILGLGDRLPQEAIENLIELLAGRLPRGGSGVDENGQPVRPIDHPDARRRFRLIGDAEDLHAALDGAWDRWATYLHPTQRDAAERDWNGPARVTGSAGTGKSIVAVHRAVNLAKRNPTARILLTTFSPLLAKALAAKVRILAMAQPRLMEQIEIEPLDSVMMRLYRARIGAYKEATTAVVTAAVEASPNYPATGLPAPFVAAEWAEVIDAWGITDESGYMSVPRLGRRQRLTQAQRRLLWAVFADLAQDLAAHGSVGLGHAYAQVAASEASANRRTYDFVIVDEAQDVSAAQLRLLAAFGAGRQNGLFLAGDIGQRIFRLPFSWSGMGVNIQGRSRRLRVNYRTSKQIREASDRLLDPQIADPDGENEARNDTISVFASEPPVITRHRDAAAEQTAVSDWIKARLAAGDSPEEIAVFVRSRTEFPRALAAVRNTDQAYAVLDDGTEPSPGQIVVGTMHLAKGLEFRSVAVMAVDENVVPLAERVNAAIDLNDQNEIMATERHLLYVAFTRARDHLYVSSVGTGSMFLDDLT